MRKGAWSSRTRSPKPMREKPDLLIDLATLTGAARVALGPELPAAYSTDAELLAALHKIGDEEMDPIWPMPLWAGYDDEFSSKVADIGNVSAGGFAGSPIAALFLKRFVTATPRWLHIDLYASESEGAAGPAGGRRSAVCAQRVPAHPYALRLIA